MKNFKYIFSFLALLCFTRDVYGQNVPNGATGPAGTATVITAPANFDPSVTSKLNFTRVFVPTQPMPGSQTFTFGSTPGHVRVATTYTNGNGQTIQTIAHRASGVAGINPDVISLADNRPSLRSAGYLSYTLPGFTGIYSQFRTTPSTEQASFYSTNYAQEGGVNYSRSQTFYQNGELHQTSFQPGKAFGGQNRGTEVISTLNNGTEGIYIWGATGGGSVQTSGTYAAGMLSVKKTLTTDGGLTTEYTDRNGQVVCKVNKLNGSQNAVTYYVYNEIGRIVAIIPPKAYEAAVANSMVINSTVFKNLCWFYVYDKYGQVVEKHVPGKAHPEEVVYNSRKLPVLSRNALQRSLSQPQWSFNVYDSRGNVVFSGLVTSSDTRASWEAILNGTTTPGTLADYLKNGFTGTAYPSTITNCDIREYNYYDTYDQHTDLAGRSFDASFSNEYLSGSAFLTPTPRSASYCFGLLTGKRTKMVPNNTTGLNQWVCSVLFYDEDGRPIQTHTKNPWNTTNWDISTTQYTFEGKTALAINKHFSRAGSNKLNTLVVTKNSYNEANGQLLRVEQKIDGFGWRTISSYVYDELGRVKEKRIGGTVEQQQYTYSIAGDLRSINRDYVETGNGSSMTFGAIISKDYGFTQPRYDGSIAGMLWRGAGGPGNSQRAYGYSYDNAGRILGADFREYSDPPGTTPLSWNKQDRDYSVSNINYDVNGNMLTMNQRGVGVSGGLALPVTMDQLTYTYQPNSNRLDNVRDAISTNYNLRDFRDTYTGTGEYVYDADGNLTLDQNRQLWSITYNEQDLPVTIIVNGGTIHNTYDDNGVLYEKKVTPTTGTPAVWRYCGPFVYRNDSLLYVLHEEGRSRWQPDSNKFKYDFHVEDHLGNIRSVVTSDETSNINTYVASMEVSNATFEGILWDNLDLTRVPSPQGDPNSEKAALTDGRVPEKRIGPAMLVQVMAGDKFKVRANAWVDEGDFEQEERADGEAMLGSILGSLTAPGTGGDEGGNSVLIQRLFSPSNFLTTYEDLKNSQTTQGTARAYLNYLVFDEYLRLVPEESGAIQVNNSTSTWQVLEHPEMAVSRNGYLALYVSNEQGRRVWFDNTQLTHWRGRLLEETHYYPHGLTIRQPSVNPVPNRYFYQGKELQSEFGLELYDFHARQYDPQIGRFWGIDPADQFPSGYTGMGNDPANGVDPTGMVVHTDADDRGNLGPDPGYQGADVDEEFLPDPNGGRGIDYSVFDDGENKDEKSVTGGENTQSPTVPDAVKNGVKDGVRDFGLGIVNTMKTVITNPLSLVFDGPYQSSLPGLAGTVSSMGMNAMEFVNADRLPLNRVFSPMSALAASKLPRGSSTLTYESSYAGTQLALTAITSLIVRGSTKIGAFSRAPRVNLEFRIGPYNRMRKLLAGTSYDAHHLPQASLLEKLIPGYNRQTAPTIAVSKFGHTRRGPHGRISTSTTGITNPRDALANGVRQLRRVYPHVPTSVIQEYIQLLRRTYPGHF